MATWCELGANMTAARCRGYKASGSSTCRGCKGIMEVEAIIEPDEPETLKAEKKVPEIKYACIEEGCKLARVKHKRCTGHNREYEAALLKLEAEVGKLKKEDIPAFLPIKTVVPPFRAHGQARHDPGRTYKPTSPESELVMTDTVYPQGKEENALKGKESAISRLLKPITPHVPLPATSIVLDFNEHECAAIGSMDITIDEIKEVVLLFAAGELGRIVKTQDPMEKQRAELERIGVATT